MRTMRTPPRKKLVPFSFGRWKKKVKVLLKPMMKTKPERKRIWEDEGSGSEESCPDGPFAPSWASAWAAGSPSSPVLTFPKARSTVSKYKSVPKKMKKRPKPTSPTPIPVEDGRAEVEAQAHSSGHGHIARFLPETCFRFISKA